MTVIEHDFGLGQRKVERRFRTLLSLDAHEVLLSRDGASFRQATADLRSERIYQLEKSLFEALQAATGAAEDNGETVSIGKSEYDRLLQCRAIVESAYAQLVADQPET
mgnify:CR=1 FL=1